MNILTSVGLESVLYLSGYDEHSYLSLSWISVVSVWIWWTFILTSVGLESVLYLSGYDEHSYLSWSGISVVSVWIRWTFLPQLVWNQCCICLDTMNILTSVGLESVLYPSGYDEHSYLSWSGISVVSVWIWWTFLPQLVWNQCCIHLDMMNILTSVGLESVLYLSGYDEHSYLSWSGISVVSVWIWWTFLPQLVWNQCCICLDMMNILTSVGLESVLYLSGYDEHSYLSWSGISVVSVWIWWTFLPQLVWNQCCICLDTMNILTSVGLESVLYLSGYDEHSYLSWSGISVVSVWIWWTFLPQLVWNQCCICLDMMNILTSVGLESVLYLSGYDEHSYLSWPWISVVSVWIWWTFLPQLVWNQCCICLDTMNILTSVGLESVLYLSGYDEHSYLSWSGISVVSVWIRWTFLPQLVLNQCCICLDMMNILTSVGLESVLYLSGYDEHSYLSWSGISVVSVWIWWTFLPQLVWNQCCICLDMMNILTSVGLESVFFPHSFLSAHSK